MTGTFIEPALEETAIEAVYVPAAKLPGLAETVIELGVVPLVRLRDNQEAPDAESVKLIVLLVLLETDSACEDGEVPPVWYPKATEVGLTTSLAVVDVDVTVSLTGTLTEPTREDIATEAVYVPADKLPGLTETAIEAGVVPLVVRTESQDAPDDLATVKLTFRLLVTDRLCECGSVPPC